jgi:acyl transferase domain-containing protein/acyl carrier protein
MKQNPADRETASLGNIVTTPIAIVGMASLFPAAHNLPEYWDNILKKVDCVMDVPPSRWNIADYYDPNPAAQDKTYCKRGGFIPDVDFDPLEFGLPPNILEVTDVSQLIGLLVARDAIEDAGYNESHDFNRQKAGVVLGVVGVGMKLYQPLLARLQYPVWEKVLRSYGLPEEDIQKIVKKIKLAYVNWEESSFPGTIGNVIAGRIANRFDLGGLNCTVDAACGSSLAAVKMAISELVEHRADLMITGGVDTDNSIGSYMCFSKTPAFSKSENVRTFDAQSDGMMVGEGIGMVVLKRLSDAERDGDRVYAVIKGVGASSDGRFKSIYAPRPYGQAIALRRAYEEAGYSPATVGLIEAHGTGTPAGDPAEVEALREVFTEFHAGLHSVALGSVKSQIAHTKAAAGAASLIKAALALHHKVLPATINVTKPSAKLELENSPFYINTETRPWIQPAGGTPRRASISSFGFGGTNYHVALEEYRADHTEPYRLNPTSQAVVLSAASAAELKAACQAALEKLQSPDAVVFLNELASASQHLEIADGAPRLGFVAANPLEAAELLKLALDQLSSQPDAAAWDLPKGIYYRQASLKPDGKVVALFSGQGSQYVDMGKELAINFPVVRQTLAEIDGLFVKDGLEPLTRKIYPQPSFDPASKDAFSKALQRTEYAQPSIGSFGVALFKLFEQAGLKADYTAGHSFGELTALWAAGVLSDQDYFFLAKSRGQAMAAPDDPNFEAGTMIAVKGDMAKIKAELAGHPEITLANFNSKNQAALAGTKADIAHIKQVLTEKGFSVVQLPVSAAFHTPLVAHAQQPFAKAIRSVKFNAPRIPVFSNTTSQPHPADPQAIQQTLEEHILKPVLFKDEIENIYAQGGFFFIEFGPKNILTGLVKNTLADQPHFAIALNPAANQDSDRQLRDAYVQLKVAGLCLTVFDPFPSFKRVSPKKKSPVTVTLNGGEYVSPKTRAAFENALHDGDTLSVLTSRPVQPTPVPSNGKTPSAVPAPTAAIPAVPPPAALSAPVVELLEHNLGQIQSVQNETLRVHELYLTGQAEYARTYSQLVQMGFSNSKDPTANTAAVEGLERSLSKFHEHQQAALKVHEQYLQSQMSFTQNLFQLVQQQQALILGAGVVLAAPATAQPQPMQSAPVTAVPAPQPVYAAAPVSAPAAPHSAVAKPAALVTQPAVPKPAGGPTLDAISTALFQIVSEKTGYPAEMIEPNMDMEADLGIDSIKKVEILGAIQTQFPELPKPDPEALAELRTLNQIVHFMAASAPSAAAALVSVAAAVPAVPVPVTVPSSAGADITKAVLAIVSEKTGYPAEMIELGMDMEADLGIDSIKKVEILGAVQSQFPDLPSPQPETLSELRTLGQIIDHFQAAASPARIPAAGAAAPQSAVPAAPAAQTVPSAAPSGSSTAEMLTKALLAIVTEKTGYPSEMLDMSMDMEADLGIDSIKKVEIMGSMQALFPELPKPDPELLAEARTLNQVVALMGRTPGAVEAPASGKEGTPQASPFDGNLPRGEVRLKSLPRPDRMSFHFPEGRSCLVTDDGTELTPKVTQAMLNMGWNVVVLGLPVEMVAARSALPEGVTRMQVDACGEAGLKACLDEVAAQFGPVGLFLHLNPWEPDASRAGEFYSERSKAIVEQVFLIAKYLKEPLNQAALGGRAAFLAAVHLDGEFGLGKSADFDPVVGGLFGLVKSLNLEWDAVFCRAIDLDPALAVDQAVEAILSEIFDPNRLITEVGYGPDGRSTLVVEPALG